MIGRGIARPPDTDESLGIFIEGVPTIDTTPANLSDYKKSAKSMDFSGIKIPFQSIRFHSKFHTGKFNDVENTLLNLSATFIQVKKIKM